MIVYLARDIPAFVMYCVNGESGSSLLIESTDSMIIGLLAFFHQLCYHHLLLLDLFLMSLCILHIRLLVTISDMVISILRLSASLILILEVLLDKFAVIMVFVLLLNL